MLLRINDLCTAFQRGRADSFWGVRVCPPPQVAEEKEEMGGVLRRQAAICFNMPPRSRPPSAVCRVTVRQKYRETEWDLSVWPMHTRSSLSNVLMTVCICFVYEKGQLKFNFSLLLESNDHLKWKPKTLNHDN